MNVAYDLLHIWQKAAAQYKSSRSVPFLFPILSVLLQFCMSAATHGSTDKMRASPELKILSMMCQTCIDAHAGRL